MKTKPTSDGIALNSTTHKGEFGKLLRDDRTIGEMIMMAKEKPSLLFKMLNLFKNN